MVTCGKNINLVINIASRNLNFVYINHSSLLLNDSNGIIGPTYLYEVFGL